MLVLKADPIGNNLLTSTFPPNGAGTYPFPADAVVGDTITFTIAGPACMASFSLVSARSVRNHAGTDYGIDLPLAASDTIEPRAGGSVRADRVELTFGTSPAHPLDCSNIQLSSGTCDGVSGSTTVWEVAIAGAAKNACLSVAVVNLGLLGDNDVAVNIVPGNVNGSDPGEVDVIDMSAIKGALFDPVTPSNFTLDLNADGEIDVLDMSIVKGNLFPDPAVAQCP